MSTSIKIHKYLPPIIATRSAIMNLRENIVFDSEMVYIFDFRDITFISRSFADEFLKFLKNSNITWKIVNANKNIKAIFKAIELNSNPKRNDFDFVAVTRFQNLNELKNFLATI